MIENYEFERGALMKRTFGKILSFALVLAMVLSMVPAVLAATNGVYQGDAIQVAPREEGTITYTKPENTTYYTYADHITYFVSSLSLIHI